MFQSVQKQRNAIRVVLSGQWEGPGDSHLKQTEVTCVLKKSGQLESFRIPKTEEVSVLIDTTRVVIRTTIGR
jgi:hypothetical protein